MRSRSTNKLVRNTVHVQRKSTNLCCTFSGAWHFSWRISFPERRILTGHSGPPIEVGTASGKEALGGGGGKSHHDQSRTSDAGRFSSYPSTTASQKWHFVPFWSSIAQIVERQTENPGALLIRVRLLCAAKDRSPRVYFQCGFFPCPHSPSVQSYLLTSVWMLKSQRIVSHSIVWTHGDRAHTWSTLKDRVWQWSWKWSQIQFIIVHTFFL